MLLLRNKMHKLVQDLEAKLRKRPYRIQKKIINDVLREVIPQEKTGKRKDGEYQRAAEGSSEGFLEVLIYLNQKLDRLYMTKQQRMLSHYYPNLYSGGFPVVEDDKPRRSYKTKDS